MADTINPINTVNPYQNSVPFDNNTANGMPPISAVNRNVFPVTNLNHSKQYEPRHYYPKRYHPYLAPSSGSSAESFLKSRITFEPFFIHNEARTKYAFVSTLPQKSSEIKTNEIRFF